MPLTASTLSKQGGLSAVDKISHMQCGLIWAGELIGCSVKWRSWTAQDYILLFWHTPPFHWHRGALSSELMWLKWVLVRLVSCITRGSTKQPAQAKVVVADAKFLDMVKRSIHYKAELPQETNIVTDTRNAQQQLPKETNPVTDSNNGQHLHKNLLPPAAMGSTCFYRK